VTVDSAIRAAEGSDAAALAALMCELGYETSTSEMQMRLKKVAGNPQYRTFVAVKEGKVCGMIGTFTLYSYEHNDLGGRILALVVAKDSQRSGIGRRLVAAAEHDFTQRNIRRAVVNTRFERKEAHEFYESLGYIRNGFRFVKNLAVAD
jgi:ribosomal protein S18 acetylase RimI-like enzyme